MGSPVFDLSLISAREHGAIGTPENRPSAPHKKVRSMTVHPRDDREIMRNSSLTSRTERSGYTLIEAILVLVLMGLLASAGVAVFSSPTRALTLEKIEFLLVEGRNRSRSTGIAQEVVLDVASQTVGLRDVGSSNWSQDSITGQTMTIDVDALSGGSLRLLTPGTSGGVSRIVFEPDGRCSRFGDLRLTDSDGNAFQLTVSEWGHVARS